eukprot:TRINITY_DN3873_c0_g1_i3.p1 TRINITY_DN3873_c0_g1~~TRINITY_DN3873_c0_g1_i3.p1  ORF type:complete len:709 (+),score=269.14 TRINITY_DN3873_c0_g1_i3:1204-3330(+)
MQEELKHTQEFNRGLEKRVVLLQDPNYVASVPPPAAVVATPRSTPKSARGSGAGGTGLVELKAKIASATEAYKAERQKFHDTTASLGKAEEGAKAALDEINKHIQETQKGIEVVSGRLKELELVHANNQKYNEKESAELKKELDDVVAQIGDTAAQRQELESVVSSGLDSLQVLSEDNEKIVKEKEHLLTLIEEYKAQAAEELKKKEVVREHVEGQLKILAEEQAKLNEMQEQQTKGNIFMEKAFTKLQKIQRDSVALNATSTTFQCKLEEEQTLTAEASGSLQELQMFVQATEFANGQAKDALEKQLHTRQDTLLQSSMRLLSCAYHLKAEHSAWSGIAGIEQSANKTILQLKPDFDFKSFKPLPITTITEQLKHALTDYKATLETELALMLQIQTQTIENVSRMAAIKDTRAQNLQQSITQVEASIASSTKQVHELQQAAGRDKPVKKPTTSAASPSPAASPSTPGRGASPHLRAASPDEGDPMKISASVTKAQKLAELLSNELAEVGKHQQEIGFNKASLDSKLNELEIKRQLTVGNLDKVTALLQQEQKRAQSQCHSADVAESHAKRASDKLAEYRGSNGELEKAVQQLKDENEKLAQMRDVLQARLAQEKELMAQALVELQKQQQIRLEQLRRRSRIFKPVRREARLNLKSVISGLRPTNSPHKSAALAEHEASLTSPRSSLQQQQQPVPFHARSQSVFVGKH